MKLGKSGIVYAIKCGSKISSTVHCILIGVIENSPILRALHTSEHHESWFLGTCGFREALNYNKIILVDINNIHCFSLYLQYWRPLVWHQTYPQCVRRSGTYWRCWWQTLSRRWSENKLDFHLKSHDWLLDWMTCRCLHLSSSKWKTL